MVDISRFRRRRRLLLLRRTGRKLRVVRLLCELVPHNVLHGRAALERLDAFEAAFVVVAAVGPKQKRVGKQSVCRRLCTASTSRKKKGKQQSTNGKTHAPSQNAH